MLPRKQEFYPESRFGGFADGDSTITFYVRVNALLEPSHVVLDVGCGRGSHVYGTPFIRGLRTLRGKVARVIGVDVDPDARDNPLIDEFYLVDGNRSAWPIDDASIHLILCDWVLEHISDPKRFFYESHRVLKPGGYLCIRTSNKWSYVSVLARWIPQRFHNRVLSRLQPTRDEREIFPTVHACNTPGSIRKALLANGLNGVVYGNAGQPSYLETHVPLYAMGVLLHKLVPRALAHTLYAFAEKPE